MKSKKVLGLVACLFAAIALLLAIVELQARQRIAAERKVALESNFLPRDVCEAIAADPALTLYSLDPGGSLIGDGVQTLHFVRILGQTTVSDPVERRGLIEHLQKATDTWDSSTPPFCGFDPRHAIRTTIAGEFHDFLICFSCGELRYFRADTLVSGHWFSEGIEGGPFQKLLIAARIPVAKP